MAERVVDVLEAVEVDEQHADAAAVAPRLRDRLRQALLQQQAVGQAGERVARGHVLQALLGLDARRHVLNERQDRDHAAFVVEQARVVPLAPDGPAVLAIVAARPVARGSSPFTSALSIATTGRRSPSWMSRSLSIGMPSASSALQPKMFSARGDHRTRRKSRSHSSTASGVLLMCDESIQLARRSASSFSFWSWMSVWTA